MRGSCTRTSALSSGEWLPSRGLLSAASGPSWYFLLLTGRGSKSLPGPRQSPAWWLSPFCSWGGEGWAWERLPAVRTSTPQLRMWRVANPGGGAQVPEGRKQEGPGRPGGRERRGGAAGTQTAPPKCPASRAECWATMGGPGPCPQWRPASSPLGEPEALRGQATAPGRPHSAPRGVQSARAHRSTWEQQAWGLARTQGVCHA